MISSATGQKLYDKEMERIVGCYKDNLLRMCFLYLKDRGLAEDAVQDTFLKVNKSYASFQNQSSEKTWVISIAINVCKNYRREFWFRGRASAEALEQIPAPQEDDEEARENSRVLAEVMNLPPKYREVVLLYYYQNMKVAEIASTLSVPISTVTVRMKRARERLEKKLKGWYYD